MVILIRAVLLYVLIIFSLRLMGKRQLGELQPTDLVSTILISNIASIPIEDHRISMIMAVIPILILASLEVVSSYLSLKCKGFRKLVIGKPVVLISNGEIDQQALKKVRFSIEDLMETLRGNDIFDLREVYYAIVETTGKVNVIKKFSSQNLTPQMTGLKGSDKDPPLAVISDGKINREALFAYNFGESWLDSLLREQSLTPNEVFLMTIDRSGLCSLVKKEG